MRIEDFKARLGRILDIGLDEIMQANERMVENLKALSAKANAADLDEDICADITRRELQRFQQRAAELEEALK